MTTEIEAAPVAADDNSEFEAAFAEFSEARDEPEGKEDSDEGYETSEPEAEPEATPEPEQQVEQKTDDLDARIAAAEKAAKDYEHRYKSEIGRQTALQKKVQELQAQLEQRPQAAASQRQYTERMQNLMGEFPEIASALQEELDARLAEVRNEVQSAVAPMKQQEEARQYQAEESRVREIYPDFVDVVKSQDFMDWFERQPPAIKDLASSPHANDALAVMDYYTGYKGRNQAAANPEVQDTIAKRQAALQRNVSVKNTAPAPVSDGPDDFESAFEYFARKRNKR